ncbi:hypothetical protein [uncultured Tenacibaculum sp.]|uniref:hypothetical protein n=1 Tax=uncultured Tenacibaculum sp. TaxID=174713 RepID=UPI002604814D|nr:hypothetical protein [uncultured Tenacibaculum sp.]
MKKLIYILTFLSFLYGFSQKTKTVSFSELSFEINKDSTEFKVKKGKKYLNGKFKLMLNPKKKRYSLSEFKNGKIIGLQKTYLNGVLKRTTEYKDGKKNGYEALYDNNGKEILLKIHYIENKRQGQILTDENGNEYYVKGKTISQEELELYRKDYDRN